MLLNISIIRYNEFVIQISEFNTMERMRKMVEEGRDIIDALVSDLGIKVKNARILMKEHGIKSVDQITAMDKYEIFALDGESYSHELYRDIMKGMSEKGLKPAEPKCEYSKEETAAIEFIELVGFSKSLTWNLSKNGIKTINDLCDLKASNVIRYGSTTKPTVDKLIEKMAEKGLELKPEFEDADFLYSLPVPGVIHTQLGQRGIITEEDFRNTSSEELSTVRGVNMRTVYELDKELSSRGIHIATNEHYRNFKERVEAAQNHIDAAADAGVKETLLDALDSWMRVYPRV